ncbi:hypothetical protein [Bradyrhizobium sp. 5.13L]|jgi:hypothetical protein
MTKLPYVRTMFATCMLFQMTYVLCVLLWLAFPELKGHEFLPIVFPGFEMIAVGSFIYGLVASMIYGWAFAIIYVFFFNLWPQLAAAVIGPRAVQRT